MKNNFIIPKSVIDSVKRLDNQFNAFSLAVADIVKTKKQEAK